MIFPVPAGVGPNTHRCGCGGMLRMPWRHDLGDHALVCTVDASHDTYRAKNYQTKTLFDADGRPVEVDILTQQPIAGIVKYQSAHGEIQLSIADIKAQFCAKATDTEARLFLEVCRYQGLNPFLKEAYLVKYAEGDPASIVVGKEVFTKRAQRIPECRGWEAGVLVARDGVLVEQEGSFLLPGDKLLGGWCRVERHGRETFSHRVALEEYIQTTRDGRPTKFWAKMPATMIRKVAIVQGLRECFPEEFQGLYDSAEITGGEVLEATGRVISQVEGAPVHMDAMSSNDDDQLPDLGNCPDHGDPWRVEAKWGRIVASHPPGDRSDKWCQFGDVSRGRLQDAWLARYGEAGPTNGWLKERYQGKTWSKMDAMEMLDALTCVTTVEDDPEKPIQPPADDTVVETSPTGDMYQDSPQNATSAITFQQSADLQKLAHGVVNHMDLIEHIHEATGDPDPANIRVEQYDEIVAWVNQRFDLKIASEQQPH